LVNAALVKIDARRCGVDETWWPGTLLTVNGAGEGSDGVVNGCRKHLKSGRLRLWRKIRYHAILTPQNLSVSPTNPDWLHVLAMRAVHVMTFRNLYV
jgi:hypothetical protein